MRCEQKLECDASAAAILKDATASAKSTKQNARTLAAKIYAETTSRLNDKRDTRGLTTPQHTVPLTLAPPKQKPSEPLNAELATHTSTSLRVYWYHPLSHGGDLITTYRDRI